MAAGGLATLLGVTVGALRDAIVKGVPRDTSLSTSDYDKTIAVMAEIAREEGEDA